MVDQPTVVSGDAHVDEDGHTLWEVDAPAGGSPEDVVVESASLELLTREVRQAIAEIATTPLQRRIVFSRLMATSSDRVSHRELAKICKVSVAQVVRVERDLAEQLRLALSGEQFPPL